MIRFIISVFVVCLTVLIPSAKDLPIVITNDLFIGIPPIFYPSACLRPDNDLGCLNDMDGVWYVNCTIENCKRPVSLARCTNRLDERQQLRFFEDDGVYVTPDIDCRFLGEHCVYSKAIPSGRCVPVATHHADKRLFPKLVPQNARCFDRCGNDLILWNGDTTICACDLSPVEQTH